MYVCSNNICIKKYFERNELAEALESQDVFGVFGLYELA